MSSELSIDIQIKLNNIRESYVVHHEPYTYPHDYIVNFQVVKYTISVSETKCPD